MWFIKQPTFVFRPQFFRIKNKRSGSMKKKSRIILLKFLFCLLFYFIFLGKSWRGYRFLSLRKAVSDMHFLNQELSPVYAKKEEMKP